MRRLAILPVIALVASPASIMLAIFGAAGWLDWRVASVVIGLSVILAIFLAVLRQRAVARLRAILTHASPGDPPSAGALALAWFGLRDIEGEGLSLARRMSDATAAAGLAWRSENSLLEHVPFPLVVLGADQLPLRHNQACRDILGHDLHPLLRQPALRVAIADAAAGGRLVHADVAVMGHTQRTLRVLVRKLEPPLSDGGTILLSLSDHSMEQAVTRARSDFVANASHELRTPLTALIGFIDTLRGPAANDVAAQARFLDIMAEQAARMARLIDDLLSLSRLEMMEHQAPTEAVDLRALLARVATGFEPRLAARGMNVRWDIAGAPLPVLGDADQLAQVAQNLIDNAVKYGRDSGMLRLALAPPPPDAGWPDRPGLLLRIADDGIGIPREHLPRLTERFYRVDTGRSRAVGGTGLGLAIVKHIVNRHQGVLRIDSTEGQGTTVSVWLPVAEPGPGAMS